MSEVPSYPTHTFATHGRTIHWVTSAVFAMPATSPVYLRPGKIAAARRTDVEGQLRKSMRQGMVLGVAGMMTRSALGPIHAKRS